MVVGKVDDFPGAFVAPDVEIGGFIFPTLVVEDYGPELDAVLEEEEPDDREDEEDGEWDGLEVVDLQKLKGLDPALPLDCQHPLG